MISGGDVVVGFMLRLAVGSRSPVVGRCRDNVGVDDCRR